MAEYGNPYAAWEDRARDAEILNKSPKRNDVNLQVFQDTNSQNSAESSTNYSFVPELSREGSNLSQGSNNSVDNTPASSASFGPWSQQSLRSTNGRQQIRRPETPSSSADFRQPMSNQSTSSSPILRLSGNAGSPVQGVKRTSSGVMKLTSPSMNLDPTHAHARNFSLDSNASKVGELSAQLKARLSYAMVKVQSGLEQRPISETENISSRLSSPTRSAIKPYRNGQHSPRMSMSDAHRSSKDLSFVTGHAHFDSRPSTSHHIAMANSFHNIPAHSVSSFVPSLAPAPELLPSNRRRSHGHLNQPQMPQSYLGSPASGAYASGSMTPTQQEQDAVDTLVLMSSPANSGHFPRDSVLSPKHQVLSTARAHSARMNSSHVIEDAYILSTAASAHHRKRRSLRSLQNASDVERLLDEMREYDSNDDELQPLHGDSRRDDLVGSPVDVRM